MGEGAEKANVEMVSIFLRLEGAVGSDLPVKGVRWTGVPGRSEIAGGRHVARCLLWTGMDRPGYVGKALEHRLGTRKLEVRWREAQEDSSNQI